MTPAFHWLPPGTLPDARRLLLARAVRAFADGYVALLLPYYLTLLGYSPLQIGVLITATLLGSGMMTLGAGLVAHRVRSRRLLGMASLLMIATGISMVLLTDFWPLLIVALVGTINPSNGDVSVFLPLEQALLTQTTPAKSRTALFARYSLYAGLAAAVGAQAAALPAALVHAFGMGEKLALQLMFALYAGAGLMVMQIYRGLSMSLDTQGETPHTPLGPSRRRVYKLAAVFSIDAFGGGFVVQSLLALWFYQRFGLTVTQAATLFLCTSLLAAIFAPCSKLDRVAHRPDQHHGVHPPAIECADHAGALHAQPAACHRMPLPAISVVVDGRAGAGFICHGRGDPSRAPGCRQPDQCSAQSGVRLESGAGRIYAYGFQFWLAAGSMWCVEDRV